MHPDPHLAEATLYNSTVPHANTNIRGITKNFQQSKGFLISELIPPSAVETLKMSKRFTSLPVLFNYLSLIYINSLTPLSLMLVTVLWYIQFLLLSWLFRIGRWEKSTSLVKEHRTISTLHFAATNDVTKSKVQQQKWQPGRMELFWSIAWATATQTPHCLSAWGSARHANSYLRAAQHILRDAQAYLSLEENISNRLQARSCKFGKRESH